ncbi:FAD-dependent oxidoreductase [Phytoactinopolyspora mesophila]|uniref:Methyltransferase domain-containing protein n=1 Tax=Phytoactinopolyspora mesophila TaxID=2650750 RepID=A0A7K3M8L7_9ACTN|nr:methyltransferase domain-containing protein [Phytoactinopolyspora mesophila]
MTDELQETYDAVVLGGGAAGLNGALMLARSRRSVLVLDAGEPRNAPANAVHGLLGHEGTPPAELLAKGRGEVRRYGGQVVDGEVVDAARDGDRFVITIAGGRSVQARRLLVASGVVDVLPDVPGVRERWGRDVLHCPYCHGWEVRDQAIGVLASGPISVHQALMFRQLSDDVVYFRNGTELPAEQAGQLAAVGIEVNEADVAALEIADDRLVGVRMSDGRVVARAALAIAPRMEARAGFLVGLGLEAVEHPSGMGTQIPCDHTGRTDVPGVWVAGNVAEPMAQVGASAAAGAMAGAHINGDLVMENVNRAVENNRSGGAGESHSVPNHHGHLGDDHRTPAEFWEDFYAADGRWSGAPNELLVSELTERPAGSGDSALDVGCGTGADAIWLAGQGWSVTAVDISKAALDEASTAAEAAGVGDRIQWMRDDLDAGFPDGTWDLVNVAYLHSPVALRRDDILRRAAAAVAPGGLLLILGHEGMPSWTEPPPEVEFPTTDDVLAALDLDGWTVEKAEKRAVTVHRPGESPGTRTDHVIRVRRLA